MLLNEAGYSVNHDSLVYDGSKPIDGTVLEITVPKGKVTEVKKGQIIDVAAGVYSVHAASGTPAAVAAETVEVDKDAEKVQIEAYTSGNLKRSGIISDPELTADDIEKLREKNIILK